VAVKRPVPLIRYLLPLAFLALWQAAVAAKLLDPLFFPPPSQLAATLVRMVRYGDLFPQMRLTLVRTAAGFVPGALAGILCGTAMGMSRTIRQTLEPSLSALYTLPKMTLLPMLMVLAGTGEAPRVILIAAAVWLQVSMHTLDGVSSIDAHYVEMAMNLRANRAMRFRRVYLPASAPQVFTGLRLGLGRAVGIAITSELLMAAGGLGGVLMRSWQSFAIDRVYASVIVVALLGVAVHNGLRSLESRLLPWRAR
jgi:ABC-type nitrate/sulfonate/bicarbonate transport system permease component